MRFVEGAADDLHADGQAVRRESARHGEGGQAERVDGPGETREAAHALDHVIRCPRLGLGQRGGGLRECVGATRTSTLENTSAMNSRVSCARRREPWM